MVKVRGTSVGRWRIFRHDAGRAAGPAPWAYVLLFAVAQLVGWWSGLTFGATVLWPANAILIAAVLQLHRRPAIGVLIACVSINLAMNVFRGDPALYVVTNAALNLIQVMVATVLARRWCGAALDMRRPRRLLRFALGAAIPAVALSTVLAAGVALATHRMPLGGLPFRVQHLFDMELLAMMIATPSLLLLARNHRFRDEGSAKLPEAVALLALLLLACLWVFTQNAAPILFVIIPPLVLLAFRLSPPWTASAVILVAVISGYATLMGHGPVLLTQLSHNPALESIPPIMRQMAVLHLFLLAVVALALPITTMSSERRRLYLRLKARTAAAHAARRQAELADQAKSRFLALMSHEMRTPLTGIAGYADVLSRAHHLDTETRRQVEAIRQCGDAMLRLVEDVLEVSRGGEEVSLRPTYLSGLLEEAVAPARACAESRKLSFEVEIGGDVGAQVLTDERRLRQVVHHIVDNAVKFTSQGGVRIAIARRGDRIRFEIVDTGCGMNDDIRSRIFSLFEQVDPSISRLHEGAGIGLALAKAHVDRLGGTIEVRSLEGCGSTVIVTVPAPVTQAVAAPAREPVEDRALRVLIVDDHPTNRDLLRIMLQAAGCDTQEATDGQEAIAAVAAEPCDIVLMDVRMPVVDGLAATRAIRAMDAPMRDVPILAVTAEAMPEDAARCLAAGMDGHLAKPITAAKLYEAIETALAVASERQLAA